MEVWGWGLPFYMGRLDKIDLGKDLKDQGGSYGNLGMSFPGSVSGKFKGPEAEIFFIYFGVC